jgi:hypothetical protein
MAADSRVDSVQLTNGAMALLYSVSSTHYWRVARCPNHGYMHGENCKLGPRTERFTESQIEYIISTCAYCFTCVYVPTEVHTTHMQIMICIFAITPDMCTVNPKLDSLLICMLEAPG